MNQEIKARIEQIKRGEVPQGYKKTKVGIVPSEWKVRKVEEIAKLSSGITPSRSNINSYGGDILWVSSGELKQKYLLDTNEKITSKAQKETNLKLYEIGTLIIAIYGLEAAGVRGTASLVSKKCCISQACMAFTELKSISSEYLYYWYIQNGQVIGIKYAQGTKQQNLSSEIVYNFQIPFPPLSKQQKIADILTTQDKVIELKEKLIAEKQLQKKWLMQNLLTGKKRLKGFSSEWEKVELGEIFDYEQPTPYLVKSTNYDDKYVTPVLTAGKTFILGYTDETTGVYENVPVVIFDDFTTASKYVDFQFKAKSSAMKILKCRQNHNIVFAYAKLQELNYQVGGHERHWISKFSFIPMKTPSLPEQTAIAEILSTADREIELLQKNLAEEKQKKKALMQLLLTGIVRV